MGGVPIGLDFAAVMVMGAAQDVDLGLLAETLPDFEAIVIAGLAGDDPSSDEEPA